MTYQRTHLKNLRDRKFNSQLLHHSKIYNKQYSIIIYNSQSIIKSRIRSPRILIFLNNWYLFQNTQISHCGESLNHPRVSHLHPRHDISNQPFSFSVGFISFPLSFLFHFLGSPFPSDTKCMLSMPEGNLIANKTLFTCNFTVHVSPTYRLAKKTLGELHSSVSGDMKISRYKVISSLQGSGSYTISVLLEDCNLFGVGPLLWYHTCIQHIGHYPLIIRIIA